MNGKKRTVRSGLIAIIVFAVAMCFALAACSSVEPEDGPKVNSVTITCDGEAVGSALSVALTEGTLELSAEVDKDEGAAGELKFTSSVTAVATVDNTGNVTLVAAGSTVITASFGNKSASVTLTVTAGQVEKYTVTVTGGTADKTSAAAGETVTLTHDVAEPGKEFIKWRVNGKDVFTNTFTMTASNATVVAVFEYTDYTVSVTGGTADKLTAHYGDTVTLTPGTPETGKEFTKWTLNGSDLTVNTFTMPADNVTVIAVFSDATYAVTVKGGTASVAGAHYGDTVTLTRGTPPTGCTFTKWTVDGADQTADTFTMPAKPVTVVANYERKYATPDNSDDRLFYQDSEGGPVEIDRAEVGGERVSMFDDSDVDYIRIYVYSSTTATSPLGSFKLHFHDDNGNDGNFDAKLEADGGTYVWIYGTPGNVYITGTDALKGFNAVIKAAIGEQNYTLGGRYYFAAQTILSEDARTTDTVGGCPVVYTDSDISAIGARGYTLSEYAVSVTGGTADKTVAHSGETVTLTPGTIPSDKEFDYWTVNSEKITGNTFTMPKATATVVAVLKPAASVTFNISTDAYTTANPSPAHYGETVTLTLGTIPSDKIFLHWTVNGVKIDGSTFVMGDSAVTVEAVLDDKPASELTYAITVTGGTADVAAAHYGDTVTLTRGTPPTGCTFVKWTVDGADQTADTFTMPAKPVTVVANYVRKYATPDNSNDKIFYQTGGEGSTVELDRTGTSMLADSDVDYVKIYVYDSTTATEPLGAFKMVRGVTLKSLDNTASSAIYGDPGNLYFFGTDKLKEFNNILRVALGADFTLGGRYYFAAQIILTESAKTTETVGGCPVVNADSDISAIGAKGYIVSEYAVSITGGTVDKTVAHSGETVTVTLGDVPSDKVFSGWTVVQSSLVITGGTFTMPTEAVTITAVLVDKISYTVTVVGGTADKTTAAPGEEITLTPDAAESGYEFWYWDVNGTKCIPTAGKLEMPAGNATFTAKYIQLTQQLQIFDNSENALFKPWNDANGTVEIDRYSDNGNRISMFDDPRVDYVLIHVYSSDRTTHLGAFKMYYVETNMGAYIASMDGTTVGRATGKKDNEFFNSGGGTAYTAFNTILTSFGAVSGQDYYFAAQMIAKADEVIDGHSIHYVDSEISVVGTAKYTMP